MQSLSSIPPASIKAQVPSVPLVVQELAFSDQTDRLNRGDMGPISRPLQEAGCTCPVTPYLDDWLLTSKSYEEVQRTTHVLLSLLPSLGVCQP